MGTEFTAQSLADAAHSLSIEPLQYNHFIEIVDGRADWQQHQTLLDAALTLLASDEPYSLRHMPPPPLWTDSGNMAGRAWRAANQNHPMAEDARSSARCEVGREILAWARYVPQAFSIDRRRTLYGCLLDCDAGIRFDLLRAVGFLGAHNAAEALAEYLRLETESPGCRAMAQILIERQGRRTPVIHAWDLDDWRDRFKAKTIHLVCVASGGLTTCDCAASQIGGMRQESEVWPLTKKVNREGETGTFWPRLSLTVVPQLKWENRPAPDDTDAFLRRCFTDVAKANQEFVKLSMMYVDLNPYGGDYDYARARRIAEEVLISEPSIAEIYFAPEAP